jgi:hypothetical protein
MKKIALAAAFLGLTATQALADDLHAGYVCSVGLYMTDGGIFPPADQFGRLNVELKANPDCTGVQTWIHVCSTHAHGLALCSGGRWFTPREMQALYPALVKAVSDGLRATAFTAPGNTAVRSISLSR